MAHDKNDHESFEWIWNTVQDFKLELCVFRPRLAEGTNIQLWKTFFDYPVSVSIFCEQSRVTLTDNEYKKLISSDDIGFYIKTAAT